MDARCLHLLQEAGRDSSERCLFLHAVFHPIIVFGGITAIVANRLLWFMLGHWAHSLLCSMWWPPHLANWSKRPSLGVPRRLYSGPPPQRGGCERGRSPSGMARWPGTSCRCGWGLGGTRRGGRTVLVCGRAQRCMHVRGQGVGRRGHWAPAPANPLVFPVDTPEGQGQVEEEQTSSPHSEKERSDYHLEVMLED